MPIPRTVGSFVLLLGFIAGSAGILRQETSLLVIATLLLSIAGYCLCALLILKLLYYKRSLLLSFSIARQRICAGERAEVFYTNGGTVGRFLCLPGILVRYELNLTTKDGRLIQQSFNPNQTDVLSFVVPERGAYVRSADAFVLLDSFGFFRCAWTVFKDTAPCILASPVPDKTALAIPVRPGGKAYRKYRTFERSDQLIDNRPYIPGDDPRRINWKLYGHAGDLFVREEEREPPPHSRLVLLLDTYADENLFTSAAQSRRAVDMLCEKALALVLDLSKCGMELALGWNGAEIIEGSAAVLTEALAYPVALSGEDKSALPQPDSPGALVIFALPREIIGDKALDRFHSEQQPDIIFLYEEERLAAAAHACTKLYARKKRRAAG
ncbi:MAG: DUF58 domain-containing protein [Spirochaetaceae bacterium]|jgi:uncharacterized protein (DUF58 family)|nr:DUF58 domain-containing protein [Spirochaetaceae bacterium]